MQLHIMNGDINNMKHFYFFLIFLFSCLEEFPVEVEKCYIKVSKEEYETAWNDGYTDEHGGGAFADSFYNDEDGRFIFVKEKLMINNNIILKNRDVILFIDDCNELTLYDADEYLIKKGNPDRKLFMLDKYRYFLFFPEKAKYNFNKIKLIRNNKFIEISFKDLSEKEIEQ